MTREVFEPTDPQTVSGTGPYTVTHPYARAEDLIVRVDVAGQLVRLVLDTDYTVEPATSSTAGTVTLGSGAASEHDGRSLYIDRVTQVEQGWAAVLGARELGLEVQLDILAMAAQENQRATGRALRFTRDVEPMVPAAGRAIVFDDELNPIPGPAAGDLTSAQGYAEAAAAARDQAVSAAAAAVGLVGISVADYGADGAGDDTAGFQAAIDALPAAGGVIHLSAANYDVTVGSLSFGARQVLWTGRSTINGSIYRALPGVHELWSPANKRMVRYEPDGAAGAFVRYDFRRDARYTGGATGEVNTLARFYTVVDAAVGSAGATRPDEWPLQARVDNYSETARGVANTGQARRFAGGAVWSGHFNTIDNTDVAAATYNTWGFEANIQGDGADPLGRRIVGGFIAHNVAQSYSGTPGTDVVGSGVNIYPDTADFTYGLHIRTLAGAGVTVGRFQAAAIRVDVATAADLMQVIRRGGPGVCRFGSDQDDAGDIVAQLVGQGNNASGNSVAYADTRYEIDDPTAGSEDGRWRVYAMRAGVATEFVRVNGGAGAPLQLNVDPAVGMQAVTRGASDSGGSGFRVLRVPN